MYSKVVRNNVMTNSGGVVPFKLKLLWTFILATTAGLSLKIQL